STTCACWTNLLGSQVRIAPDHVRRLPRSHFLQRIQRHAVLRQPAGPGVPQIMPGGQMYIAAVSGSITPAALASNTMPNSLKMALETSRAGVGVLHLSPMSVS